MNKINRLTLLKTQYFNDDDNENYSGVKEFPTDEFKELNDSDYMIFLDSILKSST